MRVFPKKFISGYIAIRALPGSPLYQGDNNKIINTALSDLEIYKNAGMDSIFLENDHDLPYTKPPLNQEAKKLMIDISKRARKRFKGPIGIQVLEADNKTALEIAVESDLDFLRVEGFVYAHIGGAGIIEGCAGELLRLRKRLRAEHIKIFADIKKKHTSHFLTSDLDIIDEARQAELFLVDGLIITGKFTGVSPNKNDLTKVKNNTKLPVIIGSGITNENIKEFYPLADGFLVGTSFRKNGQFLGDTEVDKVREFMKAFTKESDKHTD